MSYPDYLYNRGLLNRDTEDFGSVIMGKRSDYLAYCGSLKCTGDETGIKKVYKEVDGEPVECPSCGDALIYGRKSRALDC